MLLTEYVLAMMLSLSPRANAASLKPIAGAIAQAVTNWSDERQMSVVPSMLRQLITVEFHETGFRTTGTVPFGLSCCVKFSAPMVHWATRSLRLLERARNRCNPSGLHPDLTLGFYHTGRCMSDVWSRHEVLTVNRLSNFRFQRSVFAEMKTRLDDRC